MKLLIEVDLDQFDRDEVIGQLPLALHQAGVRALEEVEAIESLDLRGEFGFFVRLRGAGERAVGTARLVNQ